MTISTPIADRVGVGKTSLLNRYINGVFTPPNVASTIGASFLTKRVVDVDTGTTVRLQLWDTAGQERFRTITKLYYRGASAILLVYSIIDESSFEEMGRWLTEMCVFPESISPLLDEILRLETCHMAWQRLMKI